MKSHQVGVVIPVFNRARSVLAALDSVARQSRRPRRLVVVDDGSTDTTRAAVTGWMQSQTPLDDVVLLRQSNRGAAAARNLGLGRLSDCVFLAFLDSDDAWPPDFLERTQAALLGAPDAVAATCDRYSINADGTARHESMLKICQQPILSFMVHGAGVGSCSLFRAEPIQRHGGFRESLRSGDDAALFLRLSRLGRWLHVPGAPVTFNRRNPLLFREESALSGRYQDNLRRWAQVYEEFLDEDEWAGVPKESARRILAWTWYRAGRQLARHRRPSEARDCYRRSLHWNAWNVKAWYRYTLSLTQLPEPDSAAALRTS